MTPKRVPFVTTSNEASPHISRIVNKHWGITDFQIAPMMSYRRFPNLKGTLYIH